jgi:hypothetical protein
MPRRTDIDWEAIERDYSLGQLSIRQIAEMHGVNPSAVMRRSKKENWTKDLSERVRAETKAALVRAVIESAQAQSVQSVQSDSESVQAAVDVNVKIVTGHRKGIVTEIQRAEMLGAKFDAMLDMAADLRELSAAAAAHEAIVRSRARLVALEREAYGLSNDKDKGETLDGLAARIEQARKRAQG